MNAVNNRMKNGRLKSIEHFLMNVFNPEPRYEAFNDPEGIPLPVFWQE